MSAWVLTLVCREAHDKEHDPESLFSAIGAWGFNQRGNSRFRNVRCALVTPCEEADEETVISSGLADVEAKLAP